MRVFKSKETIECNAFKTVFVWVYQKAWHSIELYAAFSVGKAYLRIKVMRISAFTVILKPGTVVGTFAVQT